MIPDANRYSFTGVFAGRGDLLVYAFEGREAVSEPFRFIVEVVSVNPSEKATDFVGKKAGLTIRDKSGASRLVNGVIREFCRLHTANLHTHYRCVVVPRLDFLRDTQNHRIFQNKSVPDIIQEVLTRQLFMGESYSFKCHGTYQPREYCVQYGESDFHFLNRLCEEEGIYYYFEHSASGHCLCFSDMPDGPFIPGESGLRFYPGSGQPADTAVIARLELVSSCQSDAASFREWNFETPGLDLAVGDFEQDGDIAPRPGGLALEMYRFPHLYRDKENGDRYAQLEVARQVSMTQRIEGAADVSRFTPGYSFTVNGYNNAEVNSGGWWTVSVEHRGEQPQVLGHEAPDRGFTYVSSFTAIPSKKRWVPPPRHPKVRVAGKQTAIVTGPKGEEVYPDKYGRVKVQFFWDRRDLWNETATMWIRVSQAFAGTRYGTEALPRIGHEVIVAFLDGDPDRPIITGRVYHADNMPPYALPEHKTRTVFKSMSTPGAENEERGYNEFRVEDKKGEEEIFLHAQKDINLHTNNTWKEHILHDRHESVEKFRYTLTQNETHHVVGGNRVTELRDEDHLTIKNDRHAFVEGSWYAASGGEIHLESLMKAVVEAGAKLTLKVGESFVALSGAGVEISGPKVEINSGGSAGEGTPAEPLLPEGAAKPAGALPPFYRAYKNAAGVCELCDGMGEAQA